MLLSKHFPGFSFKNNEQRKRREEIRGGERSPFGEGCGNRRQDKIKIDVCVLLVCPIINTLCTISCVFHKGMLCCRTKQQTSDGGVFVFVFLVFSGAKR